MKKKTYTHFYLLEDEFKEKKLLLEFEFALSEIFQNLSDVSKDGSKNSKCVNLKTDRKKETLGV